MVGTMWVNNSRPFRKKRSPKRHEKRTPAQRAAPRRAFKRHIIIIVRAPLPPSLAALPSDALSRRAASAPASLARP